MLRALRADEIGGGLVLRTFSMNGERVRARALLTAEQLAAMRTVNRNALIEKNFIHVWPKGVSPLASGGDAAASSPDLGRATAAPTALPSRETAGAAPVERHVLNLGFGDYLVVEGRLVTTDGPVDRERAYALAGKPEPVGRNRKKAKPPS